MSKPLSEMRKGDREKMAAAFIALAAEFGLVVERRDNPEYREIQLDFRTARGLGVTVEFAGTSCQPDMLCLPWNVHAASGRATAQPALSGAFGLEQGASVNPAHFRKCTAFGNGFTDFMGKVRRALEMDRDGTAYSRTRTLELIERYNGMGWTIEQTLPAFMLEEACHTSA
jgi:hypothetical protein